MILDCLDDELDVAAFSQGTVFHFRERAREHGLMQKLLDKTVSLARETRGFSHKRLRMLIDSSPLLGAGRVEDTFNLIGRAMGDLVKVAAKEAGRKPDDIAQELSLSVVSAASVKAALDVDWRLPDARQQALNVLLGQFDVLRAWLQEQFKALFMTLNKTVVMATHDLSEAAALADNVILMREGKVLQSGSFDQLHNNPADDFVTRFFDAQRHRWESSH